MPTGTDDMNETTETFITRDAFGFHTYTGHVLTRSESCIVVTLTEPFDRVGHAVQMPIDTVVWEGCIAA